MLQVAGAWQPIVLVLSFWPSHFPAHGALRATVFFLLLPRPRDELRPKPTPNQGGDGPTPKPKPLDAAVGGGARGQEWRRGTAAAAAALRRASAWGPSPPSRSAPYTPCRTWNASRASAPRSNVRARHHRGPLPILPLYLCLGLEVTACDLRVLTPCCQSGAQIRRCGS